MFSYSKPYNLFALSALIGFCLQGIVSNTGALNVLFPDLPFPVSFSSGRTFHASISLYWTFLGLLGGIFYLFRAEIKQMGDNPLINMIFWSFALVMLVLEGSLVLRFPVGRGYLEGPWLIRAAAAVPFVMLIYSLGRLYRHQAGANGGAAPLAVLLGVIISFFAYLATVIFYRYPLTEHQLGFHIVSEVGVELMAVSLISLLVAAIAGKDQVVMDPVLYLAMTLASGAAFAALLEYFVWPGSLLLRVLMAGFFSGLHIFSALLLLFVLTCILRLEALMQLDRRQLLSLLLLAGSLFYQVFGAGVLGFLLAYPQSNRYLLGTYAVSAHVHQAMFGVFGLLALALAVYILFERVTISAKDFTFSLVALGMLNAGLLLMGFMLLAAGTLQAYLLNILGVDRSMADALLRPYLWVRIAGGAMYTGGSLLFSYILFKRLWLQRAVLFQEGRQGPVALPHVLPAYQSLLHKHREAELLLQKIARLRKALQMLKSGHK